MIIQLVKEKKHPSRYESGIWSDGKKRNDATKRECRGVLKALKKVQYRLYKIHFILETDANILVAQLNRFSNDLPNALVTRWRAWIRLLDIKVIHISRKRYTTADGFS